MAEDNIKLTITADTSQFAANLNTATADAQKTPGAVPLESEIVAAVFITRGMVCGACRMAQLWNLTRWVSRKVPQAARDC